MTRRPWLLVLAGATLVLLSGGAILFGTAIKSAGAAPLPERLADLWLTQAVYGAEAVEELNRLHAGELSVSNAAIGRYGSRGEATLWVAGASTAWQADRLLKAMTERIQIVDSPFHPDGEVQVSGKRLSRLLGMGQEHYLFQADRYVIWLSVDPVFADRALRATLEVYP